MSAVCATQNALDPFECFWMVWSGSVDLISHSLIVPSWLVDASVKGFIGDHFTAETQALWLLHNSITKVVEEILNVKIALYKYQK